MALDTEQNGFEVFPGFFIGGSNDEEDPFHPSPQWVQMWRRARLVRDLMGGTGVMQSAAKQWIHQYPKESDKQFTQRVQDTFLTPGYQRALRLHTARVFSEPITLRDQAPAWIEKWKKNVDDRGNSIDTWGRDFYLNGEDRGVNFLLTDKSRTAGRAPYWVEVSPDRLLGVRSETSDDPQGYRITQARILEPAWRPKGRFGQELVVRCKVIEPGKFTIYERGFQTQSGLVVPQVHQETRVFDSGSTGVDRVMLREFYTNKVGQFLAWPYNEELAHANLEQWRRSSDANNGLRYAIVPMFKQFGFTNEEDEGPDSIGPAVVVRAHSTEAVFDAVKMPVEPIKLAYGRIAEIEARMDVLGMQPLMANRPGNFTATQTAVEAAEAYSDIQMHALAVGVTMNQALEDVAAFEPQWSTGDEHWLHIHTDWAKVQSGSELLDVLEALVEMKDLPPSGRRVMLDELMRRDAIMNDHDVESILRDYEKAAQSAEAIEVLQTANRRIGAGASHEEAVALARQEAPDLTTPEQEPS